MTGIIIDCTECPGSSLRLRGRSFLHSCGRPRLWAAPHRHSGRTSYTKAPAKRKGPLSRCGRCLPTVQTTHNFRYSRPSPIPKTPTLILKRPFCILKRPSYIPKRPSCMFKRPVVCKLRPYRPKTRLCENSKTAFSHGDKRPFFLAQAFVPHLVHSMRRHLVGLTCYLTPVTC